ncbi:MAG TPA: hypothetical protein VE978_13790 [Chitinophagales bacterium]|nr:hypothetical protein [Chitinophagales bacterium]
MKSWTLFTFISIILFIVACTNSNKNGTSDEQGTGTTKVQYCSYVVGSCDCDTPKINDGDVICIKCDSTQTDCKATVRFTIKCKNGKTCDIVGTRSSTTCSSCPTKGKILSADVLTVTE